MQVDGRYEIIRELGRGQSSKTFLVEDTYRRSRPQCVVKQVQLQSKAFPLLQAARALFEREAQLLTQLGEQAQVPKILAYFEQNGDFFLVQEWIDGYDLRRKFTYGDRWDGKKLIPFLREILAVLEEVHRQGGMHLDIKPENLIRRWQDKRLFLTDFGKIKAIRDLTLNAEGQPQLLKPIGTPGYMPDEQLQGQPRFCSDIYAVGMMAIQALTGFLPNQLPRHAMTQAVEWHEQVEVNPELTAIIDRMVAYEPQCRYPSAAAVMADLSLVGVNRSLNWNFNVCLPETIPVEYDLVIPAQFELARNFSEGLAAVVTQQRLGYINKSGNFAISPDLEFDPISIFREGAYQFSEGLARIAIAGRWGYINAAGQFMIQPQFDSADPFSEGLARVEVDGRYGYIDHQGDFLISPLYKSAAAFREGLAGIEVGDRFGYINRQGEMVIRPQFDTADEFKQGLARVTLHDKYGFINKMGELVIPAQFDVAHNFAEGLARVRWQEAYGYIDRTGKIVIPPQFDDTFSFTEGLALVRQRQKYGYVNAAGKQVIACQFADAYPFAGQLAAVKLNQRWGFIDHTGKIVVEPQFEDAGSFNYGLAAVKVGDRWGYLGEKR